MFHRLTEDDCVRIGDKIIQSLAKRLLEQKGVILQLTENALKALVSEGYDAEFGARPLKRVVRKRIEDRLSEDILLGKITGGQKVTVDYLGGEYRFITRS